MIKNKWSILLYSFVILVLAGVLGLGLNNAASAQTATPTVAPTRQITVSGEATISAPPDYAQVTLGVQTTASTVTQAAQESNTRMSAVISSLKDLGVASSDIQTFNYEITPQPNVQNGQPGAINAYQVTNTAQVTIRDLSKTGQILDQATQTGANDISSLSFGINDPNKLRDQALSQAVADAQARADALAQAGGVQRGQVLSIVETSAPRPVPFAEASAQAAGASVPIQPGMIQVQAQVQVTYAIQ